ncbi:MAG: Response regulator UvrY [Gammaproteobacteria bacterium]|nr:Response regulator UvrY [Gammaproteobacteria bacterium]
MRIIIADDHPIVRRGVHDILIESFPKLDVVEVDTAGALFTRLKDEFDLVLLDLSLPDRNGLDCLGQIKKQHPSLPVLILSMHAEEHFAVRALKSGASGYLTKDKAAEELVRAVRRIMGGGRYVSSELAEHLAAELTGEAAKAPHEMLSDREFRVLRLIGAGRSVSEIAQELYLSVKTVSTYRTRLLSKMQLKTNADLTRYCIQNHLVE